MELTNLIDKTCKPLPKGAPSLTVAEAKEYNAQVQGWELGGERIQKQYKFEDFSKAVGFVNRLAELAEREDHHPSITIDYNKVLITLWTHSVGGLSENDFILAAKLDAL